MYNIPSTDACDGSKKEPTVPREHTGPEVSSHMVGLPRDSLCIQNISGGHSELLLEHFVIMPYITLQYITLKKIMRINVKYFKTKLNVDGIIFK